MNNESRSEAYAAAGVDITAGYRSVELMKKHNTDGHFLFILHNCIFLLRSKRASRNEMPFYS